MPTDEKNGGWGMGQVCALSTHSATYSMLEGAPKCFPRDYVERLHVPTGPPEDSCVVKAVLADRVALRWDNAESAGRLSAGADQHWEYPNLQKLRDVYALQSDNSSTAV